MVVGSLQTQHGFFAFFFNPPGVLLPRQACRANEQSLLQIAYICETQPMDLLLGDSIRRLLISGKTQQNEPPYLVHGLGGSLPGHLRILVGAVDCSIGFAPFTYCLPFAGKMLHTSIASSLQSLLCVQ